MSRFEVRGLHEPTPIHALLDTKLRGFTAEPRQTATG
jgi:hypothetical protein